MFRWKEVVAVLVGVLLAGAAHAQVRSIPQEAKSGSLRHVQDMIVEIDGVRQRLAPGAQIRDTANRIVVPSMVPGKVQVKYVLNDVGEVRRVWILTPEEGAKGKR